MSNNPVHLSRIFEGSESELSLTNLSIAETFVDAALVLSMCRVEVILDTIVWSAW